MAEDSKAKLCDTRIRLDPPTDKCRREHVMDPFEHEKLLREFPFMDKVCEAIGSCVEHLGPGLEESRYHSGISIELVKQQLSISVEPALPFKYKGTSCDHRSVLFPDIIVESHPDKKGGGPLVIELKAGVTGAITASALHQLRNYLSHVRKDSPNATGLLCVIGSGYEFVSCAFLTSNDDDEISWLVVPFSVVLDPAKMEKHTLFEASSSLTTDLPVSKTKKRRVH